MFYGEIEYQNWAGKVIHQHAAPSDGAVMQEALQLGDLITRQHGEVDMFKMQRLMRAMSDKTQAEIAKKRHIRVKRFKRMLGKMDYREEGEDLKELFNRAGRESFMEWAKYHSDWEGRDEDDSDDEMSVTLSSQDLSMGKGCFYDGMGMEFNGKSELNNPGELSSDDDE